MTDDARRLRGLVREGELEALVVELARALGSRRYDAFPGLALHVTRCALADPARALAVLGPAFVSVDEIVFALRSTEAMRDVPHEARLAISDLVNAYECLGAPLRSTCARLVAGWLGELEGLGVHVGLAAVALRELVVAYRVAALPEDGAGPYIPAQRFGLEVAPILPHLIHALRAGDGPNAVLPTLRALIQRYGALADAGKLDEPTLLWLTRLVFHDIGKQPLGRVAHATHEMFVRIAGEQEAAAKEAATKLPTPPRYPLGATLGGGAYRVESHLQGIGYQQLFVGRRLSDGAPLLVSYDEASRHDVATLQSTLAYRSPKVLELAFVGRFDDSKHALAAVEVIPQGEWLPRRVPHGRALELRSALALGRSAGRILATAAADGHLLTRVRPEYMWAEGDEITGLSARGDTVFGNPTGDAVGDPVFDRYYFAPETERLPRRTVDDRALVFSLAVMIAEWAMGRYPFASLWRGNDLITGNHGPLDLPADLAALLSAAMHVDPEERPRLVALLAALG